MPIRVVNVIPQIRSGETNFDSEPNIAVNPANPQQIVITSFTPDTGASVTTGPYFFSTDGGQTWALNSVIPGGTATFNTKDISVRFGGSSGVLYAGTLRGDSSLRMNILRKANFSGPGLMTILVDRLNIDQPWVEAATRDNTDRVFISSNDVSQRPTGRTASVDFSLNAATAAAPAGFTTTSRLESRLSAQLSPGQRQDGPSVRTAIHRSGVIYAAFMGWRTFGSPNVSDIVVTRDDNWASGAAQFQALVDPGDLLVGRRVVTGVNIAPLGTSLGTQRIGSSLTIAVDPRNSRRVYIAWCDGVNTVASPYTVRVRRSDNGGATWTGDLLAIPNSTNPGLAVNNQGIVGLLHQQLVNVAGNNRWRIHLVQSTDFFATVASDLTLADVLDSSAGASISVIIGDYTNLISIGKDFYGVFSALNQPINANFPQGVTYQRNANFVTQQLLANNNVTPVSASVDPFFFHSQSIPLHQDFYVRDWTDTAASFDTGVEPSIKDDFYVRPDIWNRRGTLPGAFVNDQPDNEPAGNGAGNIGDNWLFARISRRAAAPALSPDVVVNAHFLVSKLGTGSNYADASSIDPDVTITPGDPTVTFAAADVAPKITDPLAWHLNPVSSTHLCAAVEISTPNDPFVGISLRGRAPGWPTTDLEIQDDNNKAQRNMGLSTTPARGVGLSPSVLHGIVHNAATFPRDISIRYRVRRETLALVKNVAIIIVGGEPIVARDTGTFVLKGMQPGENRWIGVGFRGPKGKAGESHFVLFDEIVQGAAVNGFGLGVRLGTPRDVSVRALNRLRSVATRLVAGFKLEAANKLVDLASSALKDPGAPPAVWLKAFAESQAIVDEIQKLANELQDPFGIGKEAIQLRKVLTGTSDDDKLACLVSYLERVDSHLTMVQLQQGDRADILQNVRWQVDVLDRIKQLPEMREIRELCGKFIAAWEKRKADQRDYPALLAGLQQSLAKLASDMGDSVLKTKVESLKGGGNDLEALQRLHRDVLLRIQSHL